MPGGEGEFVSLQVGAQLIDGLTGHAAREYLVSMMTHAFRGIV